MLAGCTTSPANGKAANKVLRQPGSKENADEDEFSPEALARRTEAHAHYATAVIHDLNDEQELASEEYLKAALADLENSSLVLDASRRLLQLKEKEKALDLLTQATGQPQASGLLFARLGLIYALLDKKELAIEANQKAIEKLPRSLAGYQHLAHLYLQNKQYEEGLKVLDEAAKQSNVDAAFLIDLSELYLGFARVSSDQNKAVQPRVLDALTRAADLKPTSPLLLQKLADGFGLLGEPDKASELYVKLLERYPNLPGLREKLAEIYLRKQDRKRAAEQLEAIIRNNPTNPQAYYLLGIISFEEEKLKEALEYFKKTLLLNANFEPVYYDLAGAHVNLDQPREALAVLDKARAKFQQNFVGEFFTALAYARLKEFTNALQHFVAAEIIARTTETNRLNHVFYFNLGSTYERNQNYEEAERAFKKCLELAPDFSKALNYLGYMWAERGTNLTKARELIEKAVQLEPKEAAYQDSLGWVLYKLDQPKEALTYLLKAIEYSEEPDVTLYDHLGDIYATLKEPEKARAAWRKALAIEPKEDIQKKLSASSGGSGSP